MRKGICKGNISDIFFSFQGEGIYVGEPQIFVRLANCNIHPRCLYCDTEIKTKRKMTPEQILNTIEKKNWPTRFISITGGEPLLQINFLKNLLPLLKRHSFRIYLETNGTLPDALGLIIGNIDIVAMDIKLPSSGKTAPFWDFHSKCLNIGRKKEIMLKVVLTSDTEKSDFKKAISLVKETPSIPFILQPVTPDGKVKGIGERRLKEFYLLARQSLNNVRVIPQMHRVVGLR